MTVSIQIASKSFITANCAQLALIVQYYKKYQILD